MAPDVTIVIPTRDGGPLFERSLAAMRRQDFGGNVQIVVIDSGSRDGTVEAARRHGAQVVGIRPSEFQHGRTRNLALRHARHPVLVFTVQDAIPFDTGWLSACAARMEDASIAAAFGRQIPHPDADLFARLFVERHTEFLGPAPRLYARAAGAAHAGFDAAYRAIQLDNVNAIYRKQVLEKIPFPEVPIGEDLAWSQCAQQAGHRILYDPAIRVYHSHNRPPDYDFRRALAGFVQISRIVGFLPADRRERGLADILEAKADFERLAAKIPDPSRDRRPGFVRRRIEKWFPPKRREGLEEERASAMRSHLADVCARYPGSSPEERRRFLERVAAFESGKFAAEVFLSREADGGVPADLSTFVVENMKGV